MASRPGSGSSERLDQVLALVREKVAPEARGPVEAFVRGFWELRLAALKEEIEKKK